MSITTAVSAPHPVVVCYDSLGIARDNPPIIANLLKPDPDLFTPTIRGKSITELWGSVYSGFLRTPVSESLTVCHYHPPSQDCLELASTALKMGEVWRVRDLLSRLTSCRDRMSLFRGSARLTYPLKLVTPSQGERLPQITSEATVDLGEVLRNEIVLDTDTISRIQSVLGDWVLGLDPSALVVMERPRRMLAASAVEFSMPSSVQSAVQMPVGSIAPFSAPSTGEEFPVHGVSLLGPSLSSLVIPAKLAQKSALAILPNTVGLSSFVTSGVQPCVKPVVAAPADECCVINTLKRDGGFRRNSFTSLRYLPDSIVAGFSPSLSHLPAFIVDQSPISIRRKSM